MQSQHTCVEKAWPSAAETLLKRRGGDHRLLLLQKAEEQFAAAARKWGGFGQRSSPRRRPHALRYLLRSRRSLSVFPRRLHFAGEQRTMLIFLPRFRSASGSNWISTRAIHRRACLRRGLSAPYSSSSTS